MTGLDLESFLLLLRADLRVWAQLGLGSLVLGLMVWLSWGSRRALRKCLALSVVAHAGLALYGSTIPSVFRVMGSSERDRDDDRHIRRIRVAPTPEESGTRAERGPNSAPARADGTGPHHGAAPLGLSPDTVTAPLRLADARLTSYRAPDPAAGAPPAAPPMSTPFRASLPAATATPVVPLPARSSAPEARPRPKTRSAEPGPPGASAPPTDAEVASLAPEAEKLREVRGPQTSAAPASALAGLPRADLRQGSLRDRAAAPAPAAGPTLPDRPIPLDRATPSGVRGTPGPALADLTGAGSGRNLTEVPRFYRSRLDANRSDSAQRSGASAASEQAVERALDWLARHQDADGRWDGSTARLEDGSPLPGDDDFTVHCPPGQTCFGECIYWEADTALTGLALLSYLGAGYTHREGKYATTIAKGLDFLRAEQKPDGDLRGPSRAVGMYCHAMATLALCESYALSLDDTLRDPAERAIQFLVRARARDGQAWRYAPGAAQGDTSILGWVVMALKSAREIGLRVPSQADLNRGILLWLDRVSGGQDKGLARYLPTEPVTATMTAEAWVCRQFLGVGGPGPASSEAAAFLLRHPSDRGDSNYYYWYYATLAMYQHGGPEWSRWNGWVRDRIVRLQRTTGHQSGSWDPDESQYGAKGGRIYGTALATLTLEVYYRYLRLYDQPRIPSEGRAEEAPPLEAPSRRGG